MSALIRGDLAAFFARAPVYGGSLLMRAPFALLSPLWGGGELSLSAMMALPCLLAGIALGLWLIESMRREGRSARARLLVLLLCTANPITLLALEIGHPEELLGAVSCVAAVLLASRGRWAWAGLALGLAVANKQWALLALPPVLLALPACRLRCLLLAGAAAAALTAPFVLFKPLGYALAAKAVATSTGTMFQPWQIWWFFGSQPPAGVHLTGGARGARLPPQWISQISHPLILLAAAPLTIALWMQLRRRAPGARAVAPVGQALLLLALLLLLRCMLDPWDNVYYPLPFVLALLAWETIDRGRAPVLAAIASVAVLANDGWMAFIATPDDQAAVFIACTVPLALHLAARLYLPSRRSVEALFDRRRLPGSSLKDRELLAQGTEVANA